MPHEKRFEARNLEGVVVDTFTRAQFISGNRCDDTVISRLDALEVGESVGLGLPLSKLYDLVRIQ